jgi:pimeloyl-ACP methyl ester carboxylesterase
MGHSNGGQGSWYLSSRFPDRVIAGHSFSPVFGLPLTITLSYCCRRVYQISILYPIVNVKVSEPYNE